MKLTKQQIEHAAMRLNQAAEKRIAVQTGKLDPAPLEPKLTFDEKCSLIRAGKAQLKPQNQLQSYTDLVDAYSYPTHAKAVEAFKKKKAAHTAAIQKVTERVIAERDRVLDKIMLGVAEDALAAIDAFSTAK